MEFSKKRVVPTAVVLGLSGVLLGAFGPGVVREAAPDPDKEKSKLHCTTHRLEEWLPVDGHLDSGQINRVAGRLRISAERVAEGRFGYATCNRPMTEQEEERGVPIKLPDVNQGCFLLGNAVMVSAAIGAQVLCTDMPTDFRGRRAF